MLENTENIKKRKKTNEEKGKKFPFSFFAKTLDFFLRVCYTIYSKKIEEGKR